MGFQIGTRAQPASARSQLGDGLGLQQGQYLKKDTNTPVANVFVTMLDRLNVPVESFADSTGEMSELLA